MSKQFALALLLLAASANSLRAQTLADLAKKEEERRKALPPVTKIYTNKDLTEVPGGSTSAPPGSAEAPKDGGSKEADKAAADTIKDGGSKDGEKDKKDQAYWAGKMKALQTQLDRDKTFADAMQTKVNALTTDFVNRDDPVQKRAIERDRLAALAEIERLKKAVLDDQKAISDFQEEARRAGVPPGWLR
jgi:hypothetical protein